MFKVHSLPSTYRDYDRYLGSRNSKRLAHNTSVRRDPDGKIIIRYHWTDIAVLWPDESILVRTGGFDTRTTIARINTILGNRAYIYSMRRKYHVVINGINHLFNGTLMLMGER